MISLGSINEIFSRPPRMNLGNLLVVKNAINRMNDWFLLYRYTVISDILNEQCKMFLQPVCPSSLQVSDWMTLGLLQDVFHLSSVGTAFMIPFELLIWLSFRSMSSNFEWRGRGITDPLPNIFNSCLCLYK